MTWRIRAATLALALLAAVPAAAVDCERLAHDGNAYVICEVDAATDAISLHLRDADGVAYGDFTPLRDALAQQGRTLRFAMNGGMYHADRAPVGHYIEAGQEEMRVVPGPGPGNFGLLPNGVFCVMPGRAQVFETRDYLERRPKCRHATQSGPMLVIDGALHPRFLPDSTSRYVRNGVGTSPDGRRVVFALSENAVTFHEFGRLFRDGLDLPNALYFDGNVSRIFAPDLGRNDPGRRMGPIVAVTEPAS